MQFCMSAQRESSIVYCECCSIQMLCLQRIRSCGNPDSHEQFLMRLRENCNMINKKRTNVVRYTQPLTVLMCIPSWLQCKCVFFFYNNTFRNNFSSVEQFPDKTKCNYESGKWGWVDIMWNAQYVHIFLVCLKKVWVWKLSSKYKTSIYLIETDQTPVPCSGCWACCAGSWFRVQATFCFKHCRQLCF